DGGGQTLVDEAQQVAETAAELGGRVYALPDLVGDHDHRDQTLAQQLHEVVRRGAVDDDQIVCAAGAAAGADEVVGLLDRGPPGRALRPVAGDADSHVPVERTSGGDERHWAMELASLLESVSALTAPGAAQDEMRVMHGRHPGPPSKTGAGWRCRAGLLALGSSCFPPLPDPARAGPVADRGFRPRLQ